MCYRRSCYYKFLYIVSVRLYSHLFVRLSVLVNLVVFVHVIVAVPDGVAAASAIGVDCDQPTNRPTNQSTTQKPICTPLTKDFFYLFFPSCSICCPFWCSGLHHCSSVSHHPKKHTHSQLPYAITIDYDHDQEALAPPTLSIPEKGYVPQQVETFSVHLPCSGNVSEQVPLSVNMLVRGPPRHNDTKLHFKRNKICIKGKCRCDCSFASHHLPRFMTRHQRRDETRRNERMHVYIIPSLCGIIFVSFIQSKVYFQLPINHRLPLMPRPRGPHCWVLPPVPWAWYWLWV